MGEPRYGRLFTQPEVELLMLRFARRGVEARNGFPEALQDIAMRETIDGLGSRTLPVDEPLFLLRASDEFAAEALEAYVDAIVDEGSRDRDDASELAEKQIVVGQAHRAFVQWRETPR